MDYNEFFQWIQSEAFENTQGGADPIDLIQNLMKTQFEERINNLDNVQFGASPDKILGVSLLENEVNGTKLIQAFYKSSDPIYREVKKELGAIIEAFPNYGSAIVFIYQMLIQLREQKESASRKEVKWKL